MACIHGSKLDDYREWGGGSRFEPPNEAKEGFDRKRINVSWESTTRLDSLSLSPSLIALEIGLVGGERGGDEAGRHHNFVAIDSCPIYRVHRSRDLIPLYIR